MSLLNAFIDSIVSVGFSAERGLVVDPQSSSSDGSLFSTFFQPSVLAIVSADRAMYPQSSSSDFVDSTYPPMSRSNSNSISSTGTSSGRSTPASLLATGAKPSKQHSIPAAFANLPLFCCPDGVKVAQRRDSERIHYFVLTQAEGKRSYALTLTFQQPFIVQTTTPNDDGVIPIEDAKSSAISGRRPSISKIPVPIEKVKVISPTSTPTPTPPSTPPVKMRSKKMPSSFVYAETNSSSKARPYSSSDILKQQQQQQPHYTVPTLSTYMKNVSSSATPPPTRMIRTNSQSDLSVSFSAPNMDSRMRHRSITNLSDLFTTSRSASSSTISVDLSKPIYLPHCLVLIAAQPYWTAMHETISLIYDEFVRSQMDPSSQTFKHLIQRYAFLLCNTPVPPSPCDRFSLSFTLTNEQSVFTLDPPINTDRQVLDLDLSTLLLTLNIGKLLDVLAAVFTQQPLIFFSSNYSTLVTTLECLHYLIYPLKWLHVYVPLVPDGLRDIYLEGPPGAYIMGAHSRHQSIVEQELNTSITCNLDNDRNIRVPPKVEFHRIPSSKHQRFVGSITKLIEDIKKARSIQTVQTLARVRIDQQREFERQQRLETNRTISDIFLDLMVDLCGDALKPIYWKMEQQPSPPSTLIRTSSGDGKNSIQRSKKTIFCPKQYLLSKTEGDELDFYRAFVRSTAFQIFVDEEKLASTSPTPFGQIYQLRAESNEKQMYDLDNRSLQYIHNQAVSTNVACETMSSQMQLPLPSWPTTGHYLDSCIEVFSMELQNAQQERSPPVISVFAYLRGCARLARGYLLDGLRDLYLIEHASLFPHQYIESTILPRLSDALLLHIFTHESFYTNCAEWKKVCTQPDPNRMSIIDLENSGNSLDDPGPSSVPPAVDGTDWVVEENALTFEQFHEHIHRLSIAFDQETTEALFHALLHWTDNNVGKTLKKDRTLINSNPKTSDTVKTSRRWSQTTATLKETLTPLNDNRRRSQNMSSIAVAVESVPLMPAALFELFLETWRQTNIEKVCMIRWLPDDRHNQESILKISSTSVASKKDGPGQFILTQKRLYFLPEMRSRAFLLAELTDIISVEKYQHQTVFSSSRPGIKIRTSNNATLLPQDANATLKQKDFSTSLSLLLKDNHEQDVWYTIIVELWSGCIIAHQQYDMSVMNKASRHIALIDTLSRIEYHEESTVFNNAQTAGSYQKSKQRHNQASLEMALSDLSILTRMRQSGTTKTLSAETRNVLTCRLSPSIREMERHAVRCLTFVEHPDGGRSSLWCAYGSKLKIFDASTWTCDPIDISFPSTITCMSLDARFKLWIGCCGGQLFVVDTLTRISAPQLALIDADGGCQTMTFDNKRNQMLTGQRTGVITVWNAANWQRVIDLDLGLIYHKTVDSEQKSFKSEVTLRLRNPTGSSAVGRNPNRKATVHVAANESLPNPMDIQNIPSASSPAPVVPSSNDKLARIQIFEDLLFAGYDNDYILIFRISDSNTFTFEHMISVKYKTGDAITIDSFLVYNRQLWISTGCILHIFNVDVSNENKNPNAYNLLMKKPVDEDSLISMLGFCGSIWAGSLRGKIYVYRMDNYELFKTFDGHHDGVCCLCPMSDMYVISGSSRCDTSIGIWQAVQPPQPIATTVRKRLTFSTDSASSGTRTNRRTDFKSETPKTIDIL